MRDYVNVTPATSVLWTEEAAVHSLAAGMYNAVVEAEITRACVAEKEITAASWRAWADLPDLVREVFRAHAREYLARTAETSIGTAQIEYHRGENNK